MNFAWLDFLIFGNGHGLAAPFWSQRFYWLVDANTERGALYTWSGFFGSQLKSFQWTNPRPQERRRLAGIDFKPFSTYRRFGRVCVAWQMCTHHNNDPQFIRTIEHHIQSGDLSCRYFDLSKPAKDQP